MAQDQHQQARLWAEHIIQGPLDEYHSGQDSIGYTVQYRPQFQDWVTWLPGQLEGTLRGSDADFIRWAEKVRAE